MHDMTQTASTDTAMASILAKLAKIEADNAALKAQNAALTAKVNTPRSVNIKVTEKGCVSITGGRLRRMGAVFYATEWHTILSAADEIKGFIKSNAATLSLKNATDEAMFSNW
jgi:hypothetical protein